jgi:hypothetical protein
VFKRWSGPNKKKYSKIVCKEGQWCISYQQHVLYTNENSLGNEPPRGGWSVVTGKGKQPAPICVIAGGLQDNNISFDARDHDVILLDDANNADQAINSDEADGAIADDDTSKADEIDMTNKSQEDHKCNWAHVVECKHLR